jgi:hypothetical protein
MSEFTREQKENMRKRLKASYREWPPSFTLPQMWQIVHSLPKGPDTVKEECLEKVMWHARLLVEVQDEIIRERKNRQNCVLLPDHQIPPKRPKQKGRRLLESGDSAPNFCEDKVMDTVGYFSIPLAYRLNLAESLRQEGERWEDR